MSPAVPDGANRLVGRVFERARLGEVLALLRAGNSASLVVTGEAGSGKSTLLRQVDADAVGLRVLRMEGCQTEVGWGFAALHRLLGPFLGKIDALPGPQRDALSNVFGLVTGATPNRFIVGLATMSLLEEAARDYSIVCLIDDFQWVDRETQDALLFVSRRLDTEGIGLVFGVRGDDRTLATLDGIPSLHLQPMQDSDMRALLRQSAATPPRPDVAERLVAESQGNPLALLEYTAFLSPQQLLGPTSDLPPALSVGQRIVAIFGDQVDRLPPATRALLLVLAAAGIDGASAVAQASRGLGIPESAAEAAVTAGVISVQPEMAFRHPLLRSVVYDGASSEIRNRTHRELASVADAQGHHEKAAWYRACATAGPDEELAAQLESTAARAGRRGGYAAQAAFLTLAAQRSTEGSADQSRRLLTAARIHVLAGNGAEAEELLSTARPWGPITTEVDVELIKAKLQSRDYRTGHEPALLLQAAEKFPAEKAELARSTLVDALHVALETRDLTIGTTLRHVAESLLERVDSSGLRLSPMDRLHVGLATREVAGYALAATIMRAGLRDLGESSEQSSADSAALVLWMVMEDLWDDDFASGPWAELAWRWHSTGAWRAAWMGLGSLATTISRHGDFAEAQALYDQAASVLADIGNDPRLLWSVLVEFRAWQGREDETRSMAATLTDLLGEGLGYGSTHHFASAALTVLELGLGHYSQALVHAHKVAYADPPGHGSKILPDLIEAAMRTGAKDVAEDALKVLSVRAAAAGTPWAFGILARSRALVCGASTEAEGHFESALKYFAATALATETARTRLLYGEWLRRQRRRGDAHEQLSTALTAFTTMGAAGFAGRAGLEVSALGVSVPAPRAMPSQELTSQETRVARLAAQGMTNAEISEQLFITRSTVDYHMGKVFRKLQITSRRRIKDAMSFAG